MHEAQRIDYYSPVGADVKAAKDAGLSDGGYRCVVLAPILFAV